MPSTTAEQLIPLFELCLLLAGALLFFRLVATAEQRNRWFGVNRLPPWPVTPVEFAIYVFLMFGTGLFLQLLANLLLKDFIAGTADREAVEVCVYGAASGLGGLAGWGLFRSMQKNWYAADTTEPPPVAPGPALSWLKVLLYGGGTLLAAMPVVTLINVGWVFVLHRFGLPDDPQPLLAIFENAQAPLVVAGLLVVACVLAPAYEELLFRAGLYRFCRQKFGRNAALLLSGLLFGAAHTNLASFLPLSCLGMALALAYEGNRRHPRADHRPRVVQPEHGAPPAGRAGPCAMTPFTSIRAESVIAQGELRLIAKIRRWLGPVSPKSPRRHRRRLRRPPADEIPAARHDRPRDPRAAF